VHEEKYDCGSDERLPHGEKYHGKKSKIINRG
jgi:hypothetical protein